MNAVKLFTVSVAALVTVGVAAQAAQAQGKSREQVREELIVARHDGKIQNGRTQYPPTAATIARSKEVHVASQHPGETAPVIDHHDNLAAR